MKYSHVCAFEEPSKRGSVWKRLKTRLLECLEVNKKYPSTEIRFRSNASFRYEKNRHRKLHLPYIIHPYSEFRLYWEVALLTIFVFQNILNPTATIFDWEYSSAILILTLANVACLADIIIQFLTGYKDEESNEIILHLRQIVPHYLLGLFTWDVLATLPSRITFYIYDRETSTERQRHVIHVFMFLKLARLPKIFVYLQTIFMLCKASKRTSRIINHVMMTLLLLHWTTCMTYSVPYYLAYNGTADHKYSWINQANLENQPDQNKYVESLFRAVCQLLGTDHGVFEPVIACDVRVACFTFLLGKLYFAYLFVVILTMMINARTTKREYEAEVNHIQGYMRYKRIPNVLQKRVLQYYTYRYRTAYFKEPIIMETLSDRLRREIMFYCSKRLLEIVPMFQELPDNVTDLLMHKLHLEVFLPNHIIIETATPGDCMYILASGTVAVYTSDKKEICHLQDGSYFGEVALVRPESKRVATVITLEICEVYRLDRDDFQECFAEHRDLYYKIEKIANTRDTSKTN